MYMANYHVLVTVSCHITTSLFHVPADSSRATLNEVIGLDGVKVVKIAAGAEHSALVTGKVIYYELLPSSFSLWSYCVISFC